MIHTVKGFRIVNETEVDFFLIHLLYSVIQPVLVISSLVPLPFLNSACASEVLGSRTAEADLEGF